MQICTDTRDMLQGNPADPNALPADIRFGPGERDRTNDSEGLPSAKGKGPSVRRRSPAQIQADLGAEYQANLEKLNNRYATKMDSVAARVRPVAERRKEALAKLDDLRAIVRRTHPVMDEADIDGLIAAAITKAYGDLADANMAR